MADTYQPKDPKGKLREAVRKYLAAMHTMGRAPNRSVTFRPDRVPGSPPDARGWLLDDLRPDGAWDRYLLLEDGDVWHEEIAGGAYGGRSNGTDLEWLGQPNDDLMTLLARSLSSARAGGPAYLADEEERAGGPYLVTDRRGGRQPHEGPDRRTMD